MRLRHRHADAVAESLSQRSRRHLDAGREVRHRVVADGVQTREQLAFLQTHLCDEGQGYYFGWPVVPEDFAELPEVRLRAPLGSGNVTAHSAR